jgi:phage major head subunit gpT-like protein
MSLIDSQKLAAANLSFRTLFNKALSTAEGHYEKIATVVPSNAPSEVYKWLGKMPRMREWVGERVAHKLGAQSHQINNKDWEATLEVDRDDIRYDRLGIVMPMINDLASAEPLKKDELVFDLLINGFSDTFGVCYDGQNLFDTQHKAFNATDADQSNTGTAALDADELNTAIKKMNEFEDENGVRYGVDPTHIVYGPALRATVRGLLKAERDASGATNTQFGMLGDIMSHRITNNDWFLIDNSKAIRSIIFQQVGGVNFVSKNTPNDEGVFWEKTFYWGIDATFNAGYGLWQCCYGSDV